MQTGNLAADGGPVRRVNARSRLTTLAWIASLFLAAAAGEARAASLWAHGEVLFQHADRWRYGPWKVAENAVAVAGARYGDFYITAEGDLRRASGNANQVSIATGVTGFSVGVAHLVWVRRDGTVWGVGDSVAGLPDTSGNGFARDPVQIASDGVAVAGSLTNTFWLKRDGTLWGIGSNRYHQLHDGTVEDRRKDPILIASNVRQVAACSQFVLWVDAANTLWIRGATPGGPYLGMESGGPLGIRQLFTDVASVQAGRDHALILTRRGELFVIGLGREGELGLLERRDFAGMAFDVPVTSLPEPRRLADRVVAAAASETATIFLRDDGTVWACGASYRGQLRGQLQSQPTPVAIASHAVGVGAGAGMFMTLHDQPAGISQAPQPALRRGNTPVTLTVTAVSEPTTYQWYLDGVSIPNATHASHQALGPGSYQVVVGGTTASAPVLVTQSARLSNFSVRARVTPRRPIVGGFGIEGPSVPTLYGGISQFRKRILLRGAGPALRGFGVGDALATPSITLHGYHEFDGYDLPNTPPTNEGWDQWWLWPAWPQVMAAAGAFPFPANSHDAALHVQVSPGMYQPHVSTTTGAGVALFECYEVDARDAALLVNASARAWAGPHGDALVAGFSITGTEPMTVLLRAVGPTLAAFGVSDALRLPTLALKNAAGETLATNDGWDRGSHRSGVEQAMEKTRAFPLPAGSRDCAIVTTLGPGTYTATVGTAGEAGPVLVEVYRVE